MHEEIKNTVHELIEGKSILYPTDTIWGLGCDAFSKEAVDKIYEIKQREDSKSLILLVSDLSMLSQYVELPSDIEKILQSEKPTTVIYPITKNLPSYLLADDGSIAIRIPKDEFCIELIKKVGKPIVSTSANISGEATASNYSEINPTILSEVDYVVNWRKDDKTINFPSRIIKLIEGGYQTIRK